MNLLEAMGVAFLGAILCSAAFVGCMTWRDIKHIIWTRPMRARKLARLLKERERANRYDAGLNAGRKLARLLKERERANRWHE